MVHFQRFYIKKSFLYQMKSSLLGFLGNLGYNSRIWAFCQNQGRHWFALNHSDLPVIMYSVCWIILTKYVRLGYLDLIDRICIVKCS